MRRFWVIVVASACPATLAVAAGSAPSYQVSLARMESEDASLDASRATSVEREDPSVEPLKIGNPLWAIPLSKLVATRDRPLFSESRRPLAPAAAAAPMGTQGLSALTLAPQKPPFTLVGTIIGAGSRIAIVYDQTSRIASGLRPGESALGWRLRSVDPASASLEASGRIVTLELPRPEDKEPPEPRVSEAPSNTNLDSTSP